jgi:nitrilase
MSSIVADAVQAAPVFLDREATLEKAMGCIDDAARRGVGLIVFPEAFLSGYPIWLSGKEPAVEQEAFADLWESGIDVPGPETDRLGEAARAADAVVVMGVNERESAYGRTTLYNTLLTFDRDGRLVRHHRKIVPTYKERTVWGAGDGSGLEVAETGIGRLGGLICWENFMPLARYHQYAQGISVYIAVTVDDSESWHHLMRAIAAEGRLYVVSVSQQFSRSSVPGHPHLRGFPDDANELMGGGSAIIAPGGSVIAGPLRGEEGILTATLDFREVIKERHSLDVTGHYARPDLFQLTIDTSPRAPFASAD